MDKKTPLYQQHLACGGKMVPFAGYQLPVQYTGVIDEHLSVRERAGLFDVSHMGEVLFTGRDALKNLNYLFTNDFTSMMDGRVRYSTMCNSQGGVVDDMLIYRFSEEKYMVVPNAANRQKDVDFMRLYLSGDVRMEDISDSVAQIALQGPKSREILEMLTDKSNIPVKYYSFTDDVKVGNIKCLLSQTGYTGELGYELYVTNEDAASLWDSLLEAGKPFGLEPCGLGARDTLRLEAGMPLYGHEMDESISPFEADLSFTVKMQKDDFIGKAALEARGEPKITRVGLKITGRGIARENNPVLIGGKRIGSTTSGTHCPYLNGAYAMALVDVTCSDIGTEIKVEVRGRCIDAEIVPLPFYKSGK